MNLNISLKIFFKLMSRFISFNSIQFNSFHSKAMPQYTYPAIREIGKRLNIIFYPFTIITLTLTYFTLNELVKTRTSTRGKYILLSCSMSGQCTGKCLTAKL